MKKQNKEIIIGLEWQLECSNQIKDKQNVVLSAPTGSGKTNVFLDWALKKPERPIFITAPIKALSNQRWRELQNRGFVVRFRNRRYKKCPRKQ